jgi:hypothetical protein
LLGASAPPHFRSSQPTGENRRVMPEPARHKAFKPLRPGWVPRNATKILTSGARPTTAAFFVVFLSHFKIAYRIASGIISLKRKIDSCIFQIYPMGAYFENHH